MPRSDPVRERDRIERRPGTVFFVSIAATGLALFAGFGLAMAACANSVSDVFSGFGNTNTFESVRPIPIPHTACPYLQLTSAAAANAGAPWRDAFQSPADWKRFASKLSAPLAAFDTALEQTVPHVPGPVAQDLRTVLHDVKLGRVQLVAAASVSEYMADSNVFEGYTTLRHASALVGSACGPALAPPFPF